jgi:NADH-quinone oxidoreductase subunit J
MIIVFFVLAFVAVGCAISMLITRNAIYSALFLVLNFATVAILYLILGAPFIALSQITVYAGSVIVLFLFVVMLLGAERLPGGEPLRWQRFIAMGLGLVLAVNLGWAITQQAGDLGMLAAPEKGFGAPVEVGRVLFSQYVLPVQIVAFILLVAVVGAVVLSRSEEISRRRELYRKPEAKE